MLKCYKCDHNNDESHEFCEECGSKLKVELKCKKCGNHLKPDDDFCEECGAKVKESKAPHHEHKTTSRLTKYKWWIIGVGILLISGLIFVFAVPLPYEAKESYTEKIPYESQEDYTEKEPYSATETYYESESYQDQQCEYRNYDGKGGYISEDGNQKWDWYTAHGLYYYDGKPNNDTNTRYYISNYENKMGLFKVRITYWDWDNNKKILGDYIYRTINVGPHETEYGYIYYGVLWDNKLSDADTFSVQLEVPQLEECKTVTKWRDVPKTRTVTKYQNETKYRTITKYKDEYKEKFVTKYATFFQKWSGQAKYYYKV